MAKSPAKNIVPPTASPAERGLLAQRRLSGAAGLGLAMQISLAVVAFILSFTAGAVPFGAVFVFAAAGVIPWLAILILSGFRRAATVEDFEVEALQRQSDAAGGSAQTIFASELDARPAARRLDRAYRVVLPLSGLILGLTLAIYGFQLLRAVATFAGLKYSIDNARLVAGLLAGFAFAGFVLGRYLLGLGQDRPYALLKGGASYLVGTVYVFAAMALAAGAKGLGSDAVNGVMRYAVPLVLLVVGVEVLLNLVLDLYRPRAADEAPRPAFDSRLLNLLSSPGGVVRSLNEAVNYQFGFEITQSWFWRLLSRSFVWLALFGATLLILLSCVVLVQPQEMALVTRNGRLADEPLGPGIHLKAPWPISRIYRFPVTRINDMVVGSHDSLNTGASVLWTNVHSHEEKLLMVAPGTRGRGEAKADVNADGQASAEPTTVPAGGQDLPAAVANAPAVGLAAAEVFVQWKIDAAKLVDYATSSASPELRLRQIADTELARQMLRYDIDTAIGPARVRIAAAIEEQLRAVAARERLGVDVVWVGLAGVHPPQAVAESFNLSAAAVQLQGQSVEEGQRAQVETLTAAAGSVAEAERIVAESAAIDQLRAGDAPRETVDERQARLERLVQQAGGAAAQQLVAARAARWQAQNDALGRSLLVPADYAAYRQAPAYYKQRRYLRIVADSMRDKPKTVVAAGTTQLDVTFDFRQVIDALSGVGVDSRAGQPGDAGGQ